MSANGGVEAGVPDPVRHFQDWFKQEIEKREQLNRNLQAELEKYKQQNAELQARLDSRDADQTLPTGYEAVDEAEEVKIDMPVSYATYSKLREQQEITWRSLKVAHHAMERYKAKCKKLKDAIRPWQEYAKRCEERAAARSAGVSTPQRDATLPAITRPSVVASDFSSPQPTSAGVETLIKSTKLGHSRSSSAAGTVQGKERTPVPKSPSKLRTNVFVASPESPELLSPRRDEPELLLPYPEGPAQEEFGGRTPAQPVDLSRRVSSGLTESTGIPADEIQEQGESAMNLPLIQEETSRSLPNNRPALYEGSIAAPIHIKSEPNSSPVIQASEAGLARMSTFDLDEVGAHVTTPRKLRRVQNLLRGSSSFSKSFPLLGAQAGQAMEAPAAATTIVNLYMSETTRPLQPLSPNINDLPRFKSRDGPPRKRQHHLSEEVVSVTEDGDGIRSRSRPISPRKKMKADTTIQGLLSNNTPAKRMLITPKTTSASRPQRDAPRDVPNNVENDQRTGLITPSTTSNPRKQPAVQAPAFKARPKPLETPTSSRRSPQKRAIPLRQRPITDLRPEDFKLNPAAHGNLNLESMDPVRTNGEKRHLHKCTDPHCATCGSALRELAKDMPITLERGIFASTQDDLDEFGNPLTEDERILKHHLGATFSRTRLNGMSKEPYDELLLTAKTHIIAERYGRHRIRPNARGKSPPGFWDVDMPTTQDLEERAREVEMREREVVGERYREAMRRGGKWMFKDE